MSLYGTGRREGALAVGLLLVLALLIHAQGLFFGRHRLAADPGMLPPQHKTTIPAAAALAREAGVNQSIVLPALQRAGLALRRGELPLWNPDARLGEPFSASGAPVLYPPFWLLMLRGGWGLLDLVMYLHTALACLFMYRFLRVLPLSRYCAFIGGGLYGFGWFLTAQMDRLPDAAAAALLPFALEMTWRTAVSLHRERHAPLLALSLAAMFFTGGSDIARKGVGLCILLFLAQMAMIDRQDRMKAVKTACVSIGLALLLSAPLWLDYLQNAGAYATAAATAPAGLKTAGLLALGAPFAFGGLHGAGSSALADVNPGVDPIQLVLYPGALTLFLIVLGLFRPKRTYLGLFWLVVGGLGLLLTLDGPLTSWIGGLASGRVAHPGAGLLLVHVGAVVLASVALENFFEAPAARTFAVSLTAGLCFVTVLAFLAVGWFLPGTGASLVGDLIGDDTPMAVTAVLHDLRMAFLPTAITLSVISVLFLAWHRLGLLRFKVLMAGVGLAEVLLISMLGADRTDADASMSVYTQRLPATSGRLATVGTAALPPGGTTMAVGIATINTGGDAILDRTRRYLNLVEDRLVRVGPRARVKPLPSADLLGSPLLLATRVATASGATPFTAEGFRQNAAAPGPETAAAPLTIATRPTPPRAAIIYEAVKAASPAEAEAKLGHLQWRLGESVIIEGDDSDFTTKQVSAKKATVELMEEGANSLRLHVEMGDGRGYLLLRDAWAPGWLASVDGKPAPVLPADLALRAVPLAEGTHWVDLTYAPWSARFGLPAMALGFLLALGAGFALWLRR